MPATVDPETASAVADASQSTDNDLIKGVVIGTLIGFSDDGRAPLVVYPGQPGSAAIPARTTIDLFGSHIGADVVLMFEKGNAVQPIILGRLRNAGQQLQSQNRVVVDVEADGERTIVSAKEQLVLQCGKASITLTRSGKVLLYGTYVLSHSTGPNRMKGGSIQLN
jgi:Domain of unknown function (DUF6484)